MRKLNETQIKYNEIYVHEATKYLKGKSRYDAPDLFLFDEFLFEEIEKAEAELSYNQSLNLTSRSKDGFS